MNDGEWQRSRLPVRSVAPWPDVRERLSAPARQDNETTDPSSEGVASAPSGDAHGLGDAGSHGVVADGHAPSDAPDVHVGAGDDGLTEWQRQWLSMDDENDTPTPEEASDAQHNWWEGIPAVRQLLLDGLDLDAATVLLGANGSGKSTLAEGIAMAYGLAPEGGSTGSQHRSRHTESGLADQLQIIRNAGAGKGGYFLRAETMHAFFSYLEDNPGKDPEEPLFHQLSHGESFVSLVEVKFKPKWAGLYVLDEPESALSFDNQLRLLRHLQMLMATGRHQIVMATHSPILAALPGARILELDEHGFHDVDHDDATIVRQWRHFMNDPAFFLDES